MTRGFRRGERVKTIYGEGVVKRVLMSNPFEAWVRLDQRPAEEHCNFPANDERSNDVRVDAEECEPIQ